MRILNAAAALAAGLTLVWPGAVASAQPQCSDLGGAADGTTCKIHAGTDVYTIDIRYPLDYPDLQALTDYLAQTRAGFVNASQMPGSGNVPYQLAIEADSYHSGRAPRGTQSVVLKIFQDVGGPKPVTWYKAFNYDLDARRAITFDTLWAPNTKPLDTIYPIVRRELERPGGGGGTAISPGDGLNASHYQNFAISDTELIFFFSQGELLPSSSSDNIAHVPRDAIASQLALPPPTP